MKTSGKFRPGGALVLAAICAQALFAPRAESAPVTYTWNGGTSGDFTNSLNWSGGNIAPTANAPGALNARISVQNGANNALNYTATQGHTIYASDDRALFIGSGANGAMVLSGGTFESQATNFDGMANLSGAVASLTVNGGAYVNNTSVSGAKTFTVVYGGGATGTLTVNSGSFTVTTLRYGATFSDAGTGTVNLNGGVLAVGSIIDSGMAASNFNFNGGTLRTLGNSATFLQGLGSVQVQAGGAVFDSNGFDVTVAQALSGAGGLVKNGGGTLVLTGANGYNGTTTINTGTLQIGAAAGSGSLGTGAVVINSALDFNRTGSNTAAGDISGAGSLTQQGSGTTILTGTNSYGATSITAGTLQIGAGGTTGTLGAGTVTNAAALVFNRSNAYSVSNTISGAGSVTQQGTGALTLAVANNYSGATFVNDGTLVVAHNSALGTTAAGVTVANQAQLQLAHGVVVAGETATISGTGDNDGTVGNFHGALQAASGATAEWAGAIILNNATARIGASSGGTLLASGGVQGSGANQSLHISGGAGTGAVVLSGTNTYTGSTNIIRGILRLGADNALPVGTILDVDNSNASETATFDLNGYNQTVAALQRTNSGGGSGGSAVTNSALAAATLTVNQSATTTYNGAISGNLQLVKSNSGSLTLSGANTFSGGAQVDGGMLILAGGAALADAAPVSLANVAGAILRLNASETIGALSGGGATGGNVQLQANTLTIGGTNSTTYSGALSGTGGGLVKQGSGALTLAGTNSYTGATTLSAGTLALNGAYTGGGAWIVDGGLLTGTGSLNASSLTVNGGTLAGAITLNTNVTIAVGGTHAPGFSPAVQVVNGNYNMAGALTMEIDGLAGAGVVGGHDLLDVNGGTVTLSGNLILSLGNLSSYLNQSWLLIDNDGVDPIVGAFNGWAQGTEKQFGSYFFTIDYFFNAGGGSNNDVRVTLTNIVPEPSSWLLVALGAVALLGRFRRHGRSPA